MTEEKKFSDLDEIKRALQVFVSPGEVRELRLPETSQGVISGYFNDPEALAKAAMDCSGGVPGVYLTINPVNPMLLARANNDLVPFTKTTAGDGDITARQWLPLDFDPVRPSGISSSKAEHEAALGRARECFQFLHDLGFSDESIVLADSGNGAHVLVRIDLPNDDHSKDLIEKCVRAIFFRFSDSLVSVDQSVTNASRIWKLYGTLACKGDEVGDRVYRIAKILSSPAQIVAASVETLKKLAGTSPADSQQRKTQDQEADLNSWLKKNWPGIQGPYPWNDAQKWIFPICPFNAAHTNRAAYIIQFSTGAITVGCHHNGCSKKGWSDLRSLATSDFYDDFSSAYREDPSEDNFEREVNLETLRQEALASKDEPLASISVLGVKNFFIKGWSHILSGYPKAGKTHLMNTVIADSSDDSILYCSEEPRGVWNARMRKITDDRALNHVRLYLGIGATPKDILERIRSGDETIVIVDTIRNLLRLQDEKDNSEVSRAILPYIAAAREKNKTLIMLHHNRKGGGEHGEAIAGAHAFFGVVDIALEIKRDGPDESNRRLLRGWGRVIEVPKLIYEMRKDGTLIALGAPAQVTLEQVKLRVFQCLEGNEWLTTTQLRDKVGKPKPSVDQISKALTALATEHMVERDPPLELGKRPGKAYKWHLANLTSAGPQYTAEPKFGDQNEPKYH